MNQVRDRAMGMVEERTIQPENIICKGPEIEEESVGKELMHIKMVLNFKNYISGQLKPFTEGLLKARHCTECFVNVIYLSQQCISSMKTGCIVYFTHFCGLRSRILPGT